MSSQLTERRDLSFPRPEAAALEVPGGTEFNQARTETDPVVPGGDAAPVPPVASAPESPAPESAAPAADTASAAAPAATAAAPAGGTPPVAGSSDVTVAATDSVPSATTPAAPVAAVPPGPAADTAALAQPQTPEAPAGSGIAVSQTDGATAGQAVAVLPAQSADQPPGGSADMPTAPLSDPSAAGAPTGLGAPDAGETSPDGTGLPEPGFASTTGVTTNRLVSIGDDQEGDGEQEPGVESADVDPDAPALVRFAAPFENPDRDPVVAIVLIHEGTGLPGEATGLDLPVAVSFAVRVDGPEARSIADAYRSAGREVVMIPNLPPGATPTDVEVALQANFDAVPEAVALMDAPETGFQSERMAITQVVSILSDEGRGLVTFPRGLNTAQQLAERAGLPARLVFRQLDEGGEGEDVVRRTLDRAAFRARQEGVVILVGRTRPETVSAILGWAVDNAALNVKLAPISAALLAE